jgi:tetratricopeptide (TPR) repeat protein
VPHRTLLALLAVILSYLAAPPPAAGQNTGAAEYVRGLEALEAGAYTSAAGSFTGAIQGDGDNADYYLARGVAYTLAEQFPAAVADLERAQALRPSHRETRLWLLSAHQMGNDEVFRNPRTARPCFVYGGDDVPARYAEVVCNRMALEYWSSRYKGSYFDRDAKRSVSTSAPVKTAFPEAAREYVTRHKSSVGEAGDVLLARVKASVARGDCAAAMKDLTALRRASPDDTELRAYWASCLLRTGDVLHAREELTRTLTIAPFWASGYLERAEAAATLGDERRAAADLQVAATLHPPALDAMKQRVAALAQGRAPDDAVERFARSVSTDAPWSDLVDAALAVHRWTNARRQRYDEAYQDRIRVLSEGVRDDGKNPDTYEMLARFLYEHHQVPTVWNGPRGGGEQVRPQSAAEHRYELARALDLTDGALKVNGRHVNSMATKALILVTLGRGGQAAPVVDAGLAIDPKNVRLLRLKSEMEAAAAGSLASRAAGLRMGRTETHRETRADGEYLVTTRYAPSAADLQLAADLEAQAATRQREANRLAGEAKRVEFEVIPALVRESEARLSTGDTPGARHLLEQAYAYDPDAQGLMVHLAEVFGRLGDVRRQRAYALLGELMRHTTASEALQVAWAEATRTAWRSAGDALDRAATADAADARTPAYRSVVAAGTGDATGAQRLRLAALALEETRARLMGTTFGSDHGGPIAVDEVGLTLVVRLELGRAFAASRQYERGTQAFEANVALEPRLDTEHLVDLVPTGMLPDPADSTTVPVAPSLASLTAWSRLEHGRVLLAAGKLADAKREYQAVRTYSARWPGTVKGRETMYVVDSWARLGLAQIALAAHDDDEAFRLLMSGEGFPGGLPVQLETERKALTERVTAARRGRGSPWPTR